MSFPDEFRRNAVECRELARAAKSADQRQGLLELADWWEERARQFEERGDKSGSLPSEAEPDDPAVDQ